MNEKDFNEWVSKTIPATFPMLQTEMYFLKSAWLESARRADRKAREECAEICGWTAKKYGAEARTGAEACESAIRDTIKD